MPAPTDPQGPTSVAEACQLMLNTMAFIMEYGRCETGTPESKNLGLAYRFLSTEFKVPEQRGIIRKNPTFVFFPRDDD